MKVRDRVGVLADLFLGAMFADGQLVDEEGQAVRALLLDLLVQKELPKELEERIDRFDPDAFDLDVSVADFASDPPMKKRRLLELVANLCLADGILDLEEDNYVRRLAISLGLEPEEYADLVLHYEIEELRESFTELRYAPVDA